jgi:ribosome-interacting GTPase 1
MGADALVLVGLEAVGKSALFRNLTGRATGDEANLRGSTMVCRRGRLSDRGSDLIDTPGIRLEADSAAARRSLVAVAKAATILLVVRSDQAMPIFLGICAVATLLHQLGPIGGLAEAAVRRFWLASSCARPRLRLPPPCSWPHR